MAEPMRPAKPEPDTRPNPGWAGLALALLLLALGAAPAACERSTRAAPAPAPAAAAAQVDRAAVSRGRALAERLNCQACHTFGDDPATHYERHPTVAPDLRFIASKLTREWAFRFIQDPRSVQPGGLMPAYFGLSNNSDPESRAISAQEIQAMVFYLFATSRPQSLGTAPRGGDPVRGQALLASKGCLLCHDDGRATPADRRRVGQDAAVDGGNLAWVRAKTTAAWVDGFIKKPQSFAPNTRMPDAGLSDRESADIVAHLMRERPDAQQDRVTSAIPPVDPSLLDDLVFEYLTKRTHEAEAIRQRNRWDLDAKLYFVGFKSLRHYGCYGCHQIAGFESTPPLGDDLRKWRRRGLRVSDAGMLDIPLRHEAIAREKLRDPRVFNRDWVTRSFTEKLLMPQFELSPTQIEDLTAFLVAKEQP